MSNDSLNIKLHPSGSTVRTYELLLLLRVRVDRQNAFEEAAFQTQATCADDAYIIARETLKKEGKFVQHALYVAPVAWLKEVKPR